MLAELAVRNLGIIKDLNLQFAANMTALTGETGAGKTLITEAVALLLGDKADPVLVGPWGEEAEVEGRFVLEAGSGGEEASPAELIIRRVVPREGRSRSYLDGKLATTKLLGESASHLIDLHGQHSHQSLLRPAAQRSALDFYGGIDDSPLRAVRTEIKSLQKKLEQLGGDEHARQRALDMLRHQLDEITAANLEDPEEDEHLKAEEKFLAEAEKSSDATQHAAHITGADSSAVAQLSEALQLIEPFESLSEPAGRLRSLLDELGDVASVLRSLAEQMEANPARLEEIVERRNLLGELRRKYGATLADVMSYAEQVRSELGDLESTEERTAELQAEIARLEAEEMSIAAEIGAARRKAGTLLSAEITEHLSSLSMPRAEFQVSFGDGDAGAGGAAAGSAAAAGSGAGDTADSKDIACENVEFLLSANPPMPPGPLRKIASGGELSRVTLAIQLVCRQAPPSVVFDEVDAGVGGTAAVSVGEALSALAEDHQVFVVTHLPQVAALADHHLSVEKSATQDTDFSEVQATWLDPAERAEEIARMLSGLPDSQTAIEHAKELLGHDKELPSHDRDLLGESSAETRISVLAR